MSSASELRVDLGAINENLRIAGERAAGRAVLAAVKADAYGHGLVEVSRSIQEAGTAQWLGVALVSEGRQLRAAGITLPVLKFTLTCPDELADALEAQLVLTVADQPGIDAVAAAAASAGLVAPVHLKVDTGMRRIGAEPGDAVALARRVAENEHLALDGLYTHLPVSDVPDGVDFTRDQLALFESVAADVRAAVGPVPWVHAANSGAVLGHDLGSTNLVRPGIMVYGSYPDPETPHTRELRPVERWTARVAFVKQVRAGESVGYGRTWTAPRDTWVATVGIGYGDGYSRLLSNRGRMLVGGRSYPVVGRVCMDQTMLDLGPDSGGVSAGDEAVLVGRDGGEEIRTAEIAELMGTIPYEVTCLVTSRVPRRYVG
ncbi:alanine racemase [Tessaracoccus rhinocerotis]|uniref:Alanine racemase n=1 Tax=Tessaracoccus rhinocerotis TaxID=1689449 RepID=A0A553K0I4_9ACTN|nr:alanine racemase [Tessaracoccus rhinocerotis]TRY18208.1 alanine racemase [Tessaracoccus rhinocerotis]